MSETAVSETSHWRTEGPVIAAISAGGASGAVARYGIIEGIGHSPGAFAWATLIVNVVGCLLIGVLMGIIARVGVGRLVRPFLGIGFLGGFTTFSTYVADIQQGLQAGAARVALAYLVTTILLALASVWLGQNIVDRLWSAAAARNTHGCLRPTVHR